MQTPPSIDKATIYGLLRHGETVWNREKRVQGHGDSPLTALGRENIAGWARFLLPGGWQQILCSDLGRVRETVEILNELLQLPVTVDVRLREQNWGEWEGMKVEEVRREFAAELAVQSEKGWDFRPPGGESRSEVRERAFAALAAARSRQRSGKTLVVCHLGIIKCLVYGIARCSFLLGDNLIVEKGCLHRIKYVRKEYRLDTLNIRPGELHP